MNGPIVFCATGKTGFGHLRRASTIARSLRDLDPRLELALMTNAPPDRVSDDWTRPFSRIDRIPRPEMADRLATESWGAVVVDTARLPGLERVIAPRCLLLREVGPEHLDRFALSGRPWDLLLIPNPRADWTPEIGTGFARRTEWVGWIHRGVPDPARPASAERRVLLSTAGGGSPDSRAGFARRVRPLLQEIRNLGEHRVAIWGVANGSSDHRSMLDLDDCIEPTSNLGEGFGDWDLVISTAGYNSVLELAMTDVPAVLVPVSRTYDDQPKRAREWGKRLGATLDLDGAATTEVAEWARLTLEKRRRRPPLALGPSGAPRAARLLAELSA